MQNESRQLRGPLFLISVASSIGLIAMGILFIFNSGGAAELFGVPLLAGADGTYVTVAAVRDLCLGFLGTAFAFLRDRRAMGLTVLIGAIIPIGDGIVVLLHSPAPWKFLPLHWGGSLGCLVFAFLLLRRPEKPS